MNNKQFVQGKDDVLLELKGIQKHFGGISALENIDLKLTRNKIFGIIGPNGAGKTTLFNIITGYIKPDKGCVLYEGNDITQLIPPQIARLGIARGFQNLNLFEKMSVLENTLVYVFPQFGESIPSALFPRSRIEKKNLKQYQRAIHCLEELDLIEKKNSIVNTLSYSEQKILNIARLLALNGNLILLDEPMSGLDIGAIEEMLQLIKKLKDAGKTICIIEHSLDVIRAVSDEVIFLGDGKVLSQGKLSEVFKNQKLVDLYLGV